MEAEVKTLERKQKETFEDSVCSEKASIQYLQVIQHQLSKKIPIEDAGSYTVIIGSFRKCFREIIELRKELERLQIKVLSPKDCTIINPDDEFVIFQSDVTSDQKFLQDAVFSKIRYSTFVILANFNDYIGRAATLEMGYAIAHGISILTLRPVTDIHLKPYCRLLTDVFPILSHLAFNDTNSDLKVMENYI